MIFRGVPVKKITLYYTLGRLSHACSAARDHNWDLDCAEVGTFKGDFKSWFPDSLKTYIISRKELISTMSIPIVRDVFSDAYLWMDWWWPNTASIQDVPGCIMHIPAFLKINLGQGKSRDRRGCTLFNPKYILPLSSVQCTYSINFPSDLNKDSSITSQQVHVLDRQRGWTATAVPPATKSPQQKVPPEEVLWITSFRC